MYSKDGGKIWIVFKLVYYNIMECMVVELQDGSVMLNMCDNCNYGNKKVNGCCICVIFDLGSIWMEYFIF